MEVLRLQGKHSSLGCVELQVSQFGQALLQSLHVGFTLIAFAAAGAALQELHFHGQLTELEVLAFLSQVHGAANRAVLGAERCGARHSQGVAVRNQKASV